MRTTHFAESAVQSHQRNGSAHVPAGRLWRSDLIRKLGGDSDQPGARRHERAGSMLSNPFHPHLTKEPCFCRMRQTIGVVRVGLIRRHIESSFGMTSIDADCRRSLGAQRVIELRRQRAGFKHHAFGGRRSLANKLGNDLRIGGALPTPDALAITADRHRRLIHRHVETDTYSSMAVPPWMLGPGVQS
jgi:hypothetical protein